MRHFDLRTFGAISLSGPSGAVSLDEPHLIALVVMLAAAGSDGVTEDELLLRMFPGATARQARTELGRLLAVLRLRLGDEASVQRTDSGYALAPGVVTTDFRVLSEPGDAPRADFLPGLALTASPEFDEWLAALRLRVEPAVTRSSAAKIRRSHVFAVVAALAIVIAGASVLTGRSSGVKGFSGGDQIILADVRNDTGDSLFAGLTSAATIGLQQSRYVRLYPRSRLRAVYQLMQVESPDTALTVELAQQVAVREGVRFVLGLQIGREGDGYRITGHLTDVARNEVQTSATVASGNADVVAALGEVLRSVRRQLGESRSALAEGVVPLPQVTTASLEALRSFAAGAKAWDGGDYALARELWERAVDLDTGFATALGRLGGFHYYHHNREQGARYYRAALQRIERLTDWERLQLLESWAGSRGDADSATRVASFIANRYPGASTWGNYGTRLMQQQRNGDAIPAFRRALTFDSTSITSANVYINLATVLARLDRDEEALDAYHQAARIDSLILYRGNLNHEYGQVLVRLDRLAEAESAYTRMAAGPTLAARGAGFRSLGYLASWRGHIDEAAVQFERAADVSVQMRAPLTEVRNRLLLAWTHRLAGRHAEASSEMNRVMSLARGPSVEPGFLSFIVTGLVRLNRLSDAESVLSVLRSRVDSASDIDRASEALASGTLALAKSRPDSALWYARRAAGFPQELLVFSLLGEAHQALGQRDSAEAALRRVLDADAFGAESQEVWVSAHLLLGDLLLSKGDTARARHTFQALLQRWREAPPALPELVTARARLVALAGTSDR